MIGYTGAKSLYIKGCMLIYLENLFRTNEKKVLYENVFVQNLKRVSKWFQISKPFLGFVWHHFFFSVCIYRQNYWVSDGIFSHNFDTNRRSWPTSFQILVFLGYQTRFLTREKKKDSWQKLRMNRILSDYSEVKESGKNDKMFKIF